MKFLRFKKLSCELGLSQLDPDDYKGEQRLSVTGVKKNPTTLRMGIDTS